MQYPKLKTYVSFSEDEEGRLLAIDHYYDHEEEITPAEYRFAKRLNGKTDPASIPLREGDPSAAQLLRSLKHKELITESRFVSKSPLCLLYSLWFPKRTRAMVIGASIYTLLLRLLWVPVFAGGLFFYVNYADLDFGEHDLLGLPLGILAGIILHELSHAMAGFAYGAKVFEAGVMLRFFMPGAYVLLDDNTIKGRMNKCRVYAAGVEMNMLLAGTFFFLCGTGSCVFWFAAIENTGLALINLLFIAGLDGYKIITTAMGDDELFLNALSVLLCREDRLRLRKKGVAGKATGVAYALIALTQAAYPALLLLNVLSIVEMIFA